MPQHRGHFPGGSGREAEWTESRTDNSAESHGGVFAGLGRIRGYQVCVCMVSILIAGRGHVRWLYPRLAIPMGADVHPSTQRCHLRFFVDSHGGTSPPDPNRSPHSLQSSASIYSSAVVPLCQRYETPIDLTLMFLHAITVLLWQYLVVMPVLAAWSRLEWIYKPLVGIFTRTPVTSPPDPPSVDGDSLEEASTVSTSTSTSTVSTSTSASTSAPTPQVTRTSPSPSPISISTSSDTPTLPDSTTTPPSTPPHRSQLGVPEPPPTIRRSPRNHKPVVTSRPARPQPTTKPTRPRDPKAGSAPVPARAPTLPGPTRRPPSIKTTNINIPPSRATSSSSKPSEAKPIKASNQAFRPNRQKEKVDAIETETLLTRTGTSGTARLVPTVKSAGAATRRLGEKGPAAPKTRSNVIETHVAVSRPDRVRSTGMGGQARVARSTVSKSKDEGKERDIRAQPGENGRGRDLSGQTNQSQTAEEEEGSVGFKRMRRAGEENVSVRKKRRA